MEPEILYAIPVACLAATYGVHKFVKWSKNTQEKVNQFHKENIAQIVMRNSKYDINEKGQLDIDDPNNDSLIKISKALHEEYVLEQDGNTWRIETKENIGWFTFPVEFTIKIYNNNHSN